MNSIVQPWAANVQNGANSLRSSTVGKALKIMEGRVFLQKVGTRDLPYGDKIASVANSELASAQKWHRSKVGPKQ